MLPSLQALQFLRQFRVGDSAAQPPFLGFGDPALEGAVVRAHVNAEAYALNIYQTASRLMAGAATSQQRALNIRAKAQANSAGL